MRKMIIIYIKLDLLPVNKTQLEIKWVWTKKKKKNPKHLCSVPSPGVLPQPSLPR